MNKYSSSLGTATDKTKMQQNNKIQLEDYKINYNTKIKKESQGNNKR